MVLDDEATEPVEMDLLDESDEALEAQGFSSVLIASNVNSTIFTNPGMKEKFESVFSRINPATFVYLPSFKRIRISYDNIKSAIQAKMAMDQLKIRNQPLNLFFLNNPFSDDQSNNNTLEPPIPQKQFLISPPASPPVGWVQKEEDEPFCFDLVAAVLELAPGEDHKIHHGTASTPSVVVSICDEPVLHPLKPPKPAGKIQQTRRPGAPMS